LAWDLNNLQVGKIGTHKKRKDEVQNKKFQGKRYRQKKLGSSRTHEGRPVGCLRLDRAGNNAMGGSLSRGFCQEKFTGARPASVCVPQIKGVLERLPGEKMGLRTVLLETEGKKSGGVEAEGVEESTGIKNLEGRLHLVEPCVTAA